MDYVWRTGIGQCVQLSKMDTDHIKNTISHITRNRNPSYHYNGASYGEWRIRFIIELKKRERGIRIQGKKLYKYLLWK